MTEQFAFIVNNQTLTFADLKANHGLYLRSIEQSAAVSWDLATSKNPYIDGSQVNNRTANSREMVIEFGYDRKVEPADADAALFSYFAAADDGKITVKKTRGNVNKYIDGVIRDISQEVYTDEPILQIVLFTYPFWRGNEINVDISKLSKIVDAHTSTSFLLENYEFEGEAQTGFKIYLQIKTNPTAYDGYLGGNFFGKYFRLYFTAKALPYTDVDWYQIFIEMMQNVSCYQINWQNNGGDISWRTGKDNLISGWDNNSKYARLIPHKKNGGAFWVDGVTGDALSGLRSDIDVSIHFLYTPLYIR